MGSWSKNQPESIVLPWIRKYGCTDFYVLFCLAALIFRHRQNLHVLICSCARRPGFYIPELVGIGFQTVHEDRVTRQMVWTQGWHLIQTVWIDGKSVCRNKAQQFQTSNSYWVLIVKLDTWYIYLDFGLFGLPGFAIFKQENQGKVRQTT